MTQKYSQSHIAPFPFLDINEEPRKIKTIGIPVAKGAEKTVSFDKETGTVLKIYRGFHKAQLPKDYKQIEKGKEFIIKKYEERSQNSEANVINGLNHSELRDIIPLLANTMVRQGMHEELTKNNDYLFLPTTFAITFFAQHPHHYKSTETQDFVHGRSLDEFFDPNSYRAFLKYGTNQPIVMKKRITDVEYNTIIEELKAYKEIVLEYKDNAKAIFANILAPQEDILTGSVRSAYNLFAGLGLSTSDFCLSRAGTLKCLDYRAQPLTKENISRVEMQEKIIDNIIKYNA